MQNKSCHFFFLCLRKLRCTKHYMTLCEQRLAFTTSAWYYYKALIWRSLIVVWIFHQPTVMSSQMSDQRRQGLTIYLCTWCIIRPRFIIASLSQCHRFASLPKFIISLWHWQETVFLHNILWSIAHMCIQSHDCYQHWQSVCLSTILEPITCCCYKLLSRLQQFRQIFRVS